MKVANGERIGIAEGIAPSDSERPSAESRDVASSVGKCMSRVNAFKMATLRKIGELSDRAAAAFLDAESMKLRCGKPSHRFWIWKREESEICVAGNRFSGHVNETTPLQCCVMTGDSLSKDGLDALGEDEAVSCNSQVAMACS